MSPTILRVKGYRLYFFSREESRIHVHVISGNGESKFWLEPDVRIAKNYGHNGKQVNEIKNIVKEHYHEIYSAWQEHFNG